jgi:hypothetical protein
MINWKNLLVTDSDGDSWGELGAVVSSAPANLDGVVVENGAISEWNGFYLSAEDETPDWDTPRGAVDWTGFTEALSEARA